jgi:beta-barrel assembly-enhancing protease
MNAVLQSCSPAVLQSCGAAVPRCVPRCCSAAVLAAVLRLSTTASAFVLISVNEEVRWGRDAHAAMRKQAPLVADPAVGQYVANLGRRLASSAEGPKYPYSFTVADYAEVNALALPGGHVWINRGALQAARNESQLAGVLAHEVAHVALRHTARQVSNVAVARAGLGFLSALLGNVGGAITSNAAATTMASGVFLGFSREDEREADHVGTDLLRKAGWDPRGLAEFLDIVRVRAQRTPSTVDEFFSTHPALESRLAELRRRVPTKPTGRRDSVAFRECARRLSRLPLARR